MRVATYTPTFNQRPDLLARAVRTSLEQPEVTTALVVNDGGDEAEFFETLHGVRGKLAETRILPVSQPENLAPWGVWWPAMQLLGELDIDWVLRVPSDDYSLPGRVARLLEFAQETGAQAIYHDHFMVDESGIFDVRRYQGTEHRRLHTDNHASASMVRLDVILEAGDPAWAGHCHDWLVNWRIQQVAGWHHLPEVLSGCGYYQHGLSRTRDGDAFQRERARVYKEIQQEMRR